MPYRTSSVLLFLALSRAVVAVPWDFDTEIAKAEPDLTKCNIPYPHAKASTLFECLKAIPFVRPIGVPIYAPNRPLHMLFHADLTKELAFMS